MEFWPVNDNSVDLATRLVVHVSVLYSPTAVAAALEAGAPLSPSPSDARVPRVLVTREDPAPISAAVRLVHGEPVELPLLTTRWLAFELPVARTLESYDWIAFTSARALEAIAAKARTAGWSWPPQVAAAAVGDRTAHELQACGWMPECVSEEPSASGLVQALTRRGIVGARILFPCSSLAEPTFPAGVRAAGAMIDVLPVYTTTPVWATRPDDIRHLGQRLAAELARGCVVTCASPSAARALVELAQDAGIYELLRQIPIVVMGSTTAAAVARMGLQPVNAGGRTLAALARRAVEIGRGRP